MRKLLHYALLFVIPVTLLIGNSCTPESCFEETESFLVVNFYSYSLKTISAPDSLSVWGVGHESVKIYNKTLKAQKVKLPINPSTANSRFVVKINGVSDTLEIKYSSYPHLISKECGYTFYHNLEAREFTKHNIDSVPINKTNLTTLNEESIRIYY